MGVLRVKVSGTWVDVGGSSDPIWVDPLAPSDPNIELWYDTDATSYDSPQPAALGRVISGTSFDAATSGTAKLYPWTSPATPMSALRKYMGRLDLANGWYGTTAADNYIVGFEQDGVDVRGIPVVVSAANAYIPPGQMSFPFTTTTGNHTYRAYAYRSSGAGSLQFRGRLDIYDDGPI